MYSTPYMGLKAWNLTTDVFDYGQLEGNFASIDQHNHTMGQGRQIPTGGIEDGAITSVKIAAGAFTVSNFAPGVIRYSVQSPGGNFTASDGQMVIIKAGHTVTLPGPNPNLLVNVQAASGVSGNNPAVVASTSGNIYGDGLSAASGFLLGMAGADVTLTCDGTNWYIIGGAQDSGWADLDLGLFGWFGGHTGITSSVSNRYNPGVRLIGTQVWMRGSMLITTDGSISNSAQTVMTVPTFAIPDQTCKFFAQIDPGGVTNNTDFFNVLKTTGNLNIPLPAVPITLNLDGRNYALQT